MNRNDIEKVCGLDYQMHYEISIGFFSFFVNVIEKEKDILIEKILK
jgi:hypothetical protein